MVDDLTSRAFVLHQMPYRETSALVDFVTANYGCIRAVCRGVRSSGKTGARLRSALQPLAELELQLSGKSELKTVKSVEVFRPAPLLNQQQLYAAIYINELTQKLSIKHSAGELIYDVYRSAVLELSKKNKVAVSSIKDSLETTLRCFEFDLLAALGFEIDFSFDSLSGDPIDPKGYYQFNAESGFVAIAKQCERQNSSAVITVEGSCLLRLANSDFADAKVLAAAKRISRAAINHCIEGKPLNTRSLYR